MDIKRYTVLQRSYRTLSDKLISEGESPFSPGSITAQDMKISEVEFEDFLSFADDIVRKYYELV